MPPTIRDPDHIVGPADAPGEEAGVTADPAARIAELLAKQDIYEVLARYLRACDRGDVEGARRCYLPDATEDHGGVFSGSATDYLDSVSAALAHPRAVSTHAMTNVLIDVDPAGRSARAESYVLAFARARRHDGGIGDSLTAARLIDDLRNEGGRWGIAHRTLRFDWNHDMDRTEGWVFGLMAADPGALKRSAKFPEDPVYQPAGIRP